MSNCEKSSYFYDSSPLIGTTDQVLWQGGDIPCLGICDGSRLTTMQTIIAEKICEIVGDIDMSTLTIPDCLKDAWDSQDLTILNLIQFALDQHCQLKAYTDGLPTTSDPFVVLDYCCCNDSTGCNTSVNLQLSAHIQKIINCLCETKSELASLKTEVATLYATKAEVNAQKQRIDCLRAALINFSLANKLVVPDFVGLDLTGCN